LIRRNSHRDDRGASAVEYALLVAGVAAFLIVITVSLTAVIKSVMVSNCEQTAKQNLTSSADANCDR
jgi:pilus assembly protein Flp/PilA